MTRSFKILCHCCNVIFIMSNVCCPLCDCGTNCRHVCVWVGKKKTSWSIYIKTLCIFCLIPRIMNGKTSNARGIPWLVFFFFATTISIAWISFALIHFVFLWNRDCFDTSYVNLIKAFAIVPEHSSSHYIMFCFFMKIQFFLGSSCRRFIVFSCETCRFAFVSSFSVLQQLYGSGILNR